MNWDRIEGNWKQFKGKAKEQWGKLTDDDLDVVSGKRDQLTGRIQERYGVAKDEAERQIDDWTRRDKAYWGRVAGAIFIKKSPAALGDGAAPVLIRSRAAVTGLVPRLPMPPLTWSVSVRNLRARGRDRGHIMHRLISSPVLAGGLARMIGVMMLTALLCVAGRAALAAVVDDGAAADNGAAELGFAFGVAVDPLGNYYVVDQSKHRVVKFDPDGIPRKIFGRYGFGNGQLYGPQGIAVGSDSKGDTRVYVADTFNSRVVIFDDNGAYKGKFGAYAPGASQ